MLYLNSPRDNIVWPVRECSFYRKRACYVGVWSFVLFNKAWSQKGHLASNTTVILTSSYLLHLLLLHIIITFVITFSHIFLLLIFYAHVMLNQQRSSKLSYEVSAGGSFTKEP